MTHTITTAVLLLAVSGSLAEFVAWPKHHQYVTPKGGNTNGGNSQGSNTQVGGSSSGGITIYGQGGSGGSQGGSIGGSNAHVGGPANGGYAIHEQGGSQGKTNGQITVGGSSSGRIVISQNGNKNVYQIYPNQASYNCAACKWCCVAKVPGQYVGTIAGGSTGGSLTIQTNNGGTNGGANGGTNGASTSGGSSGGSSIIVDRNNGNGNGYVAPPTPTNPNVPCVPSTTYPPTFPPGTTNPPIFPTGTTNPPIFPPGTTNPPIFPPGTTNPPIFPPGTTNPPIFPPGTTNSPIFPPGTTLPPVVPCFGTTTPNPSIPTNPTNPNVPIVPGPLGCCQVKVQNIQATVSCGALVQGKTCCNSYTQVTGGCGGSRSVTVQVSRNSFNTPPIISCQTALQYGIIRQSDLVGVCSGGSIEVNIPTTVAPTISIPTVEPTVTIPVGPNQGSYVVPTGTGVASSATTASPISFFSAIVTIVIATVMCL